MERFAASQNTFATQLVFEKGHFGEGGGQTLTATPGPPSIYEGGRRSLPGRFEAIEEGVFKLAAAMMPVCRSKESKLDLNRT